MTVQGIQQKSHSRPPGHGHSRQPVLGTAGFTTEVVEELLVKGSIASNCKKRSMGINRETIVLSPVGQICQQLSRLMPMHPTGPAQPA